MTNKTGTNVTTIILSTNDYQERDDKEESNAVSKRHQQDTSRPFELEFDVLCLVQKMQTMKEKMDMMISALRGQVSTNFDELVQQTDSPFTAHMTSFPLRAKFQMLQVKAYDGSWDPLDHFELFKIFMHLQGVLDEIMYRAFLTTLKGPARIWFSKLTPKVQKILSGHTKHYTTGR